jgi:hypothetical protein
MPDNFNLEKIVLKGYFERSEKTKEKEKKFYEDFSQRTAEMKEILDFKNQNFPFEVNILYLNSDSGIFIARGDDVFGESVIYGKIIDFGIPKQRKMEFKQIYFGEPKHKFPVRRADSIDYAGLIEGGEKRICCAGTWQTHKNSPEKGVWVLNYIKKGVWVLHYIKENK